MMKMTKSKRLNRRSSNSKLIDFECNNDGRKGSLESVNGEQQWRLVIIGFRREIGRGRTE